MIEIGPSYFVRFSPDGAWLASCGTRTLELRRPGAPTPEISVRVRNGSSGEFATDSRSVVLKTTSGALYILDPLESTADVRIFDKGRGEGAAPRYSGCGRYIIDASWSGQLVVLDAATGKRISQRRFPADMLCQLAHAGVGGHWLVQHSPRATTDTEPPDPDYFSVWSIPLPETPHRLIHPNLRLARGSALSHSGARLAVVHGAPPENLSIVDVGTGETLLGKQIRSGGTGHRMAWTSDGALAVVEEDCLRIYSNELEVIGHYELKYACDVAFSPRQRLVAIGSWTSGRVLPIDDILA